MKAKKNRSTGAAVRPTHGQITELAHTLWLEDGKSEGREQHHWLEAEWQLTTDNGESAQNS